MKKILITDSRLHYLKIVKKFMTKVLEVEADIHIEEKVYFSVKKKNWDYDIIFLSYIHTNLSMEDKSTMMYVYKKFPKVKFYILVPVKSPENWDTFNGPNVFGFVETFDLHGYREILSKYFKVNEMPDDLDLGDLK